MVRSCRIGTFACVLSFASFLSAGTRPPEELAEGLVRGLREIETDPEADRALDAFLETLDSRRNEESADGAALFDNHVQPILIEHCISCHGREKQKGGLRLDLPMALHEGGVHGPVIIPGNPSESRLIRAVRYGDPDLQMPPKGKLPDGVIAHLERWIARGAPWPGAEDALAALDARMREDVATSEKYWAFRPGARPQVPKVDTADWVSNPIDAFILAKLREQNLEPSPFAERRTLIRRVYLDVLGIPPTPEEVESFVGDSDPAAYVRLINRVLESPHYGERWARHWLDVVRFAETNGFETNTPRRNAWHYRDYVIQALNEDKAYTDFIREQLVGDALGVTAATGFLVAGPMDEVKSPDVVLTKNQRDSELHDMVSTIGGAFLGLTVGCAKCHDHKFDPISQRDYYRMRAMIAGVRHGEQDLPDPDAPQRLAEADVLREKLHDVEVALLRFVPKARADAVEGNLLRRAVSSLLNVERFDPVGARYIRFTVLETSDAEPCIDELEIYAAKAGSRNVALASAGATASASSEFTNSVKHKTIHLNDGKYGNDFSWIPKEKQGAWVQIDLPDVQTIDRIVWARDREGGFKDRVATNYRIEVATEPGNWRVVATSGDREPYNAGGESGPLYSTEGLDDEASHELEDLLARQKELTETVKQLTRVPKVYAGKFEEPETTHLLRRGDPMHEGDAVLPGTPAHVGAPCDLPADSLEQNRRRALADWIASPDNPLTARVIVNRIWQHHFGRGIVDTPSDLGAMGARPTHPELLDWLANELVNQGWRLKSIHRMILLSSTYRQSASPRPDAMLVDADTRLLWRFPPRRLEAEPIRDSILSVSGNLDVTMGGPGYDVFEPNDSYVHIYVPKAEFAPTDLRRMIYQWKPRVEQDITFGVFDCPDATQATPTRVSSTSPLQALSLLNSPFTNQQAEAFAKRLEDEAGENRPDQVRRGFALAFGRAPDDEESRASEAFVVDYGLVMFCRALFSANEFLYLN